MTHAEVFRNFETLLDKHESPYYDGYEKEFLIYDALLEWLKLHYKEYENTEKRRQDIDYKLALQKNYGSTNILKLNTANKFFLIAGITGEWNFICNGTTTKRVRAIKPITHDAYGENTDDPFNMPTDAFPQYKQYFDGLNSVAEIISDTVGSNIVLTYIKTPEKILTGTPNAVTELPDWAMHEVLRHAAAIALAPLENFQRHQIQRNIEIPLVE